jgi:acyl-coenzyme A thioesterase PaaI-like protein
MSNTPQLPKLTEGELAKFQAEWNAHPGMRHMGVQFDFSTPGIVRATVDPIQDFHRGGMGTDAVNGAVIAGVFDLAIGFSAYVHTGGGRVGVVQLSMQYQHPVRGDRFEAVGRVVRPGKTLIFSAAELKDQHGRVCARCDGLVTVRGGDMPAPPAF